MWTLESLGLHEKLKIIFALWSLVAHTLVFEVK